MLKKQGNIIEDIDLFIAATCIVYDLTLITFNQKHFLHIPDLKEQDGKEWEIYLCAIQNAVY